MRSVLIATPCYGGMVCSEYLETTHRIRDVRPDAHYDFALLSGESSVDRARNTLTATFLDTDYETLAFIDADIDMSGEDFWHLVDMPYAVRGAAVAMKTPDHSEALSCWKDGAQVRRAEMPADPFTVDYLGAAVMMIAREAIVATVHHRDVKPYDIKGIGICHSLFAHEVHNDTLLSEDYTFCKRVREMGFQIYCDPSVQVRHFGRAAWRA